MYSNKEIIDESINNNRYIINHVYKTQYPIILGWVKKNSGSVDDTNDIFHEAFLIIIRKIKAEGLTLHCNFSTYFFSICKHLWFQELRSRSRFQAREIQEFHDMMDSDPDHELEEKKLQIFLKHLNLLETKCRQLLLLFSNRKSLSEIRQIMGFINNQAVADKKKNCKKKLIQNLLNCKEYKGLLSEISVNN